jgi:hypothetical protein
MEENSSRVRAAVCKAAYVSENPPRRKAEPRLMAQAKVSSSASAADRTLPKPGRVNNGQDQEAGYT